MKIIIRKAWVEGAVVIGLMLLIALPRLVALNQYVIVDEADRWRWAKDFVAALSQGDLAATRVGDGYPGIVPVWAESVWILLEATRRSLVEGGWIGAAGLYQLFHEWDRPAYLIQQRLPIVLLNTLLALAIVWAVWRLYGRRVAIVTAILIGLDPFYLSDSRVNRAEAVITGLMTLSMLALIFYQRQPRWRYVIISGILGGLSFLTKIQALAILPAVGLIALCIYGSKDSKRGSPRKNLPPYSLLPTPYSLLSTAYFIFLWLAAAVLTWILLWPSMWVSPLDTLNLVYEYTTRKVGAEGVNLFFMGQTYADADPGLIFYPFVLLMRITPLALLGLVLYGLLVIKLRRAPISANTFILVIYIIVYAGVMTLGSHKQDRYLLPVFLGLDILAAIGLAWLWAWLTKAAGQNNKATFSTPYTFAWRAAGVLFPGLILLSQLVTVLPHHPYYYSYFNPLLGGGQTAVRTMRIGWGEGMDQVGAYLAAKPHGDKLVVSSRFTHNMVGFKGDLISLLPDGRWTQADYIVLYIQQVQRRQEPSPAFIDYFQARSPEKVVTIGGINYAWIYPIPFTTPANPAISKLENQAALLGYRWESAQSQLRVWWENLGLDPEQILSLRLGSSSNLPPSHQTIWTPCQPDPAFETQAKTPGAYVESICKFSLSGLRPGSYTVEFGLAAAQTEPTPFVFPQGWQAATISDSGMVTDTPDEERLAAIAYEALPPEALLLDRIYEGRVNLAAYRFNPPAPKPGQPVELTLYWQVIKEVAEPLRLTVQLADSRAIGLGRSDQEVRFDRWLLGQVKTTTHAFTLPAELETPLGGVLEVSLWNKAEVTLPATTRSGQPLGPIVAKFTIPPQQGPTLTNVAPVEAVWPNGISLQGYTLSAQPAQAGQPLDVRLFWQASQPVAENYVVFVHLLDQARQIKAQNDDLPRHGAYPIPWWQSGELVEDSHPLMLAPDLPSGSYQLVVGLYRPEDGLRLTLPGGADYVALGGVTIQ